MFKKDQTLRKQLFRTYVYKNCDNFGYWRENKVGFARFDREMISDDVTAVAAVVKMRTDRWRSFKPWVARYVRHITVEKQIRGKNEIMKYYSFSNRTSDKITKPSLELSTPTPEVDRVTLASSFL